MSLRILNVPLVNLPAYSVCCKVQKVVVPVENIARMCCLLSVVHAHLCSASQCHACLLQALSASAPMIALWDDHEFANNVSTQTSYAEVASAVCHLSHPFKFV